MVALTAELAFVTAPANTPTVTETMTADASVWLGSVTDFDLGAPTFEADPESVGGEYGYRTVSFTLKLIGTYTAVAAKMQTISRQLLADRNWLSVQWQSNPKFFLRTYRTAPQTVGWSQVTGGVWLLPVTLVCDPFLYGPEATIGPVSISNATPFYTLGTISGDAPAPLTVSMAPTVDWTGYAPLFTLGAYTPSLAPSAVVSKEAESYTLNTDAASAADGTMSGGNRVTVSFATVATHATRLTGTVTMPVGMYRVLVRAQKSVATDVFSMQFAQSITGTAYYGDIISFSRTEATAAATATWVDLGTYMFPFGAMASKLRGVAASSIANIHLVRAGRTSGTGSLYLDTVHFIPADGPAMVEPARSMRVAFPLVGPATTQTVVLDAEEFRFNLQTTSTGDLAPTPPPLITGGYPRVVPGATNIFQVYAQTNFENIPSTPGGAALVTSGSASYTFNYFPRYLYLRAS